jgi:hypothetical protein
MDLRDIRWDGMDWIDLNQDKNQCRGSFEHVYETSDFIKCWEVLE